MFLKVAVTGFALLIGLPATATTTATPSAKAQRKLSRGPRVTAPASLSAIGRQIPARVPAAGKAAKKKMLWTSWGAKSKTRISNKPGIVFAKLIV